MTFRHWLIFILSAILFAAPVLSSSYTWPLVFAFAVPLLYLAVYNNFPAWYGYVWGIIAFGIHTSGVFWGMDTIAQGSIAARCTPILLIISYLSLYALAWFGINKLLISLLHLKSITQKLILWIVTYWLFIMFMEQYCLSIFGRFEGYFLFNPLLILAEKPQLLTLLPYVGKSVVLLLLLSLAGSIVYAYIHRSLLSLLVMLIFAVPWLASLAITLPEAVAPTWLSKVAHVPIIIPEMQHPHNQAVALQNVLKNIAQENPNAQLIIMPESSMQCNQLSTMPSLGALWSEKELGRPLHIVVGAFRWDGPYYRNTLHWFYNGILEKIYDKRHAMLLTEQIPPQFKINVLEDLFFKTFPGITPSTELRPVFDIFDEISFIPYICSELFFNDQPDDGYPKGSTILATTNDFWCKETNIAHLMHLAARFRAIQWEQNILYISFLYATYFDTYGNKFTLHTKYRSIPS